MLNGGVNMKKLTFTKSIAFEKALIDKLEDYLKMKDGGQRINFSAEVTDLIECGLKHKQDELDGQPSSPIKKPTLHDIIKGKN